ncbi:substrate-binding domain-containing protein [bacterium]|nr:substrate-binding domain-containing protein [bacterium]
MMEKRKTLVLSFLLIPLLFFGCGKKQTAKEEVGEKKGREIVLGYSTPALNNTFWIRVTNGINEECNKRGVKVIVTDAQDNPNKQLSDVEDLIQKKVDALLISPYESDPIVPAVQSANRANIPVIIVDIGTSGGEYASLIISDNIKGGKLAGEYMVKVLNGEGKVAHIQCQLGAVNAQKRGQGFEEALKGTGVKVVAKRPADSRRDLAMKVMEDILQRHPDLDGVFAQNDEMALGALQAIEAAGKLGKIKVIGFDGNKDALEAIKAGKMLATVAQLPEEMGKMAVDVALKVLKGEKVEKNIYVPVTLVTKENVDEFLSKFK